MNEIKNVIFSGGGFKCWAYIGTIQALDEYIPFENIKSVIGVSCGSVFGLFYVLQFEYSFLLNYFLQLDIKSYIDIDIDSVITNQSLIEGKKYKIIIQELVKTKVDPDITFLQLFEKVNILFTVVAFNITDTQIEYFNKDNTPHIKVVDAIMASSALPVLFPAYKINDKLYYDGGICNNCPYNLIKQENENEDKTTLAFKIGSQSNVSNNNLYSLIYSITILLNQQFNNTNDKKIINILDSKYDNETVNLNQSNDTIFNMYIDGYKRTKNAFNGF